VNRFICFTKDYPIGGTYNVIEDIKLLNERDNMLGGFLPVDKCEYTTEKAFQKKLLSIKVSQRYFTQVAVSDIVILVRSKRAPMGYSYIGEINGHAVCIKYSTIPTTNNNNNNAKIPPSISNQNFSGSPYSSNGTATIAPPVPPRPLSYLNTSSNSDLSSLEQSFVYVSKDNINSNSNPPGYNTAQRSFQSQQSHYNPLQGVPFEINPLYSTNNNKNEENFMDFERISRRCASLNIKFDYDFKLEKSLLSAL
jgi:ESCRT-I complex subunit MVB12